MLWGRRFEISMVKCPLMQDLSLSLNENEGKKDPYCVFFSLHVQKIREKFHLIVKVCSKGQAKTVKKLFNIASLSISLSVSLSLSFIVCLIRNLIEQKISL